MGLSSETRFADKEVQKSFYRLTNGDSVDKQLFANINKALDNIEKDAFCGIQISKKLIPKYYKQKYDVKNLWKYNLPNGWRLIYSIINDEIVIVSIVLEWMDHKDYENRFKY